jgi:hypothetical protein
MLKALPLRIRQLAGHKVVVWPQACLCRPTPVMELATNATAKVIPANALRATITPPTVNTGTKHIDPTIAKMCISVSSPIAFKIAAE